MSQAFPASLNDTLLEIQQIISFVLFAIIEIKVAFLRNHPQNFNHPIRLKEMNQFLDSRIIASNHALEIRQ
jgi:hypothetical protein